MELLLLPYYMILEYLLILQLRIKCKLKKTPPDIWNRGRKGTFVIVHGLHEKWNFLEYIGNYLNSKGYKILTVKELGDNTMPVSNGLKVLENFIKKNNLKIFNFLCHSKGGIISKLLLNNPNYTYKIGQVINIATPYKGSWLAKLANQPDLLPNSKIIKMIPNNPSVNKKIINLYPKIDNHVLPNSSSILKGANNIEVDIVGHTRILTSEKTLHILSKYI